MGIFDLRKYAIICKGKDVTNVISKYEKGQEVTKVWLSGKEYTYKNENIKKLSDPEKINVEKLFLWESSTGYRIKAVEMYTFRKTYCHILDGGGKWRLFLISELVLDDTLQDKGARDVYEYLVKAASLNPLTNDEGERLLEKEYSRINGMKDSIAKHYLNPKKYVIHKNKMPDALIFPFGGNLSQFKAVENALSNNLSVIEGPPGTGKTQTILNIIANVIASGKSVEIVSNNNSAIENVGEKLNRNGFGFLVAELGKKENKDKFFATQSSSYPDMAKWEYVNRRLLNCEIEILRKDLETLYEMKACLAKRKEELEKLRTEKRYYEYFILDQGIKTVDFRKELDSDSLSELSIRLKRYGESGRREFPLFFRINSVLFKKIGDLKTFRISNVEALVISIERKFYERREIELCSEIAYLSSRLESEDLDGKEKRLKERSLMAFKDALFERYGKRNMRPQFDEKNTLFLEKEYPVILSTCFSSRSSLRNTVYDYLIMDEASQVSLTEGFLSLSGAKNAVIVGDTKQLRNVIEEEELEKYDALFSSYGLSDGYSFIKHSFLESIIEVSQNLPRTLLREHYRCHPKIIGFCNEKFYDGELIAMRTGTESIDNPIRLLLTPPGKFRRGNINHRQEEVLVEYIKSEIGLDNICDDNFAVISPYRKMAENIRTHRGWDADTVHKFQGREKDTVALTLVDDEVSDFSDDPTLLNVAISRAVNHLIVVCSSNEENRSSNVSDLISYIKYNNFEVIRSDIYSIFDLLYKENEEKRLEYLSKHNRISEYDSENLMNALLLNILKSHSDLNMRFVAHYPMRYLVKDFSMLTEEECRFIRNSWTHIDFMFFNLFSSLPVLAIEVDGVSYHKEGSRQKERDILKDGVLNKLGIPILRFRTDGSREKEKIENFLQYGKAK